MIVLLRCKRVS